MGDDPYFRCSCGWEDSILRLVKGACPKCGKVDKLGPIVRPSQVTPPYTPRATATPPVVSIGLPPKFPFRINVLPKARDIALEIEFGLQFSQIIDIPRALAEQLLVRLIELLVPVESVGSVKNVVVAALRKS